MLEEHTSLSQKKINKRITDLSTYTEETSKKRAEQITTETTNKFEKLKLNLKEKDKKVMKTFDEH